MKTLRSILWAEFPVSCAHNASCEHVSYACEQMGQAKQPPEMCQCVQGVAHIFLLPPKFKELSKAR